MIKIPDFIVDATGPFSGPSVSWAAGDRRYHFWIDRYGEPDDVLHSNPIERNPNAKRDEHRSLNMTAKKWAPLIAAIMEKVRAENLIEKAEQAAKDKEEADRKQRIADREERLLKVYDTAAAALPYTAKTALASLTRAEKIAFILSAGVF